MSIMQFIRIFWARRWLIVAATLSCLLGAIIVTQVLPARWDAHSRVMLNLLKPDPVTGQIIAGNEGRVYAATQIELITDYSIAGQVAEQLGWLSDPTLIDRYRKRSKSDQRDFRSWLSQLIIENTKAKLIEDSNILEITYTGVSAANAKAVVDVLRKVYIDDALVTRREDAERNAEWFEQQTAKAKSALEKATETETAFERANGVVMANDKTDVDSARLQALTTSGGVAPSVSLAPQATSGAQMELAQMDAQLASEAKVLGPNNPELQALRSKRASIAAIAASEKAASRAAASGSSASAGAFERAVSAQKAKIIADSGKIGQLQELQNDVNLRRDEVAKLSEKVAQYRQEALVSDAGLTPLGSASTPKGASFPNYALILPGAVVLGGGLGVLLALLMELLGRRVRGVEDLAALMDLPVVGVIGGPNKAVRARLPALLGRLRPRLGRSKVATA